jgi:hypothetical protein
MQNLIKNEKITKYKDIHKSRDEFLQTIFPDAKGEQPNKEE